MKILVIDYLSPSGHVIFDLIHIKSLLDLDYSLDLVGRKDHFSSLSNTPNIKIIDIPECFYKKYPISGLTERIQGILCLWWINKQLDFKKYDKVIFLSYDILSLFIFRTELKVFLINHNNVDQLDNKIKLFLTKHLPKNFSHIVLNEYMRERVKSLMPETETIYIPHGYLIPTSCHCRPSFIKTGEKFLFCPVNRNYNATIVSEIVCSTEFNKFLVDNGIILYIKPQMIGESNRNIRILQYLNDEEYNYMISYAIATLLPYGDSFKYRCSGILFECVARNTPILATDCEAMKIYKDDINIHYFNNVQTLISSIQTIQSNKNSNYNINKYQPKEYWRRVLNN